MSTLQEKQALQTVKKNEIAEIKKEMKLQFGVLGGLAGTLWALELVDTFILNQALNAWGLAPGKISGLIGVLTMPFLHGGLAHLAANTVPFLLFSWLIMLRDNREWAAVTAATMVTSGVGTWLIAGANSVHVGASGLIFGYFGYLLTIGIFQRKISSILLSLFVGLGYGGLIFGMFPMFVTGAISWQAHLFGFVGGVISAYAINKRTKGGKRRLLENTLGS